MADDFVPPVKVLLKAIDTGIKLANRIYESAHESSAEKALLISESTPQLISALERSSQAIRDSYRQHVQRCGDPFTRGLVDDKAIQKQLKDLKNDIRDKIDEIDEDAESVDREVYLEVQTQAQKCADDCVSIFEELRNRIVISSQMPKDDRAQLSSMRERAPSLRKPVPPPSQGSPTPSASLLQSQPSLEAPRAVSPSEPPKPRSPWAIDTPSQFAMGAPLSPSSMSPPRRNYSRDISPSSLPEPQPRLISQEIVDYRMRANEEWLERRRQSRILFQNELRKSVASIGSIEEYGSSSSPSGRYSTPINMGDNYTTRPISNGSEVPYAYSSGGARSPIEGRGSRSSLNDYNGLMTRNRSQGQASQATRSSRTSSLLSNPQTARQESQGSLQVLQSGPLSPPISEHRSSRGAENWSGSPRPSPSIRVESRGSYIDDGLQVVTNKGFDDEKMVVSAHEAFYSHPTPTTSMKSIDYTMRHDTSFYKFKGFCEGAKAMMRGETGFKVVKRPSGTFSAIISARCIKCSYEVGWSDVEKDTNLSRNGIYGNSGIRWRQRFISKCHVRTDSIESAMYACIFCIEEHKTVEDHDATVFFSVTQLFSHLATHPRPLPNVAGINVIYGLQPPHIVDFDIHLTVEHPKVHTFCMREISQKVATRAAANAVTTFHPKNNHHTSRDPDGDVVLHFAAGARIVGITFPDRFGGAWCRGYHDGERGSFPSSHVSLEKPAKEDVLMDAQSTLITYAKWDFKPIDSRDGDWLSFKKGDKLVCIGYTFPDSWCWSGQNSKGKWGLFPAAFVEKCQNAGTPQGVARKESGFSLMPKMSLLSRNKSRNDSGGRKNSVMSNGSGGGSPGGLRAMVKGEGDIEVVQSLFHAGPGWR